MIPSQYIASGEQRTVLPSSADTAVAKREQGHLQILSNSLDEGLSFRGRFQIKQQPVELEIPVAAMQLLIEIMTQMAQGKPISIIPSHAELTTQQAADFLNVSRPYFVKLLKENKIPYTMVGTRRRVLFQNLITYKMQDIARRNKILDEMTAESQSLASDLGEDY